METEPTLAPATFTDFSPQDQSLLFSLPPELRYEIFSIALTTAPDKSEPNDQDAICTRPGYESQTRTHTELLRTCKRIYMEAWFMPFLCSEHAFYMAWQNRSPKRLISKPTMQKCLNSIYERHGKVEGGSVRVFAQLWALEDTRDLGGLLSMENFHPRSVTVTIRYTDTWYWERDHPLFIDGAWGGRIRLPASVTEFKVDLESLERRREEVDYITREMMTGWSFRRSDGVLLKASGDDSISSSLWTGSSMLGGARWIRDETRPGKLDYYVGTVTFKPTAEPPSDEAPVNPHIAVTFERRWSKPSGPEMIETRMLERAAIPEGCSAEEAKRLLTVYYSSIAEEGRDDSSSVSGYDEFAESESDVELDQSWN